MTMEKIHCFLGKAFSVSMFLTLLIAPTQRSLQIQKGLLVCGADVLLALAALIRCAHFLTRSKDEREDGFFSLLELFPPWPFLLFTLWCGVAALAAVSHDGDTMLAGKEFIQVVEYFLVGAALFNDYLKRGNVLPGLSALFLGAAANVGWAVFQYRNIDGVADAAVAGGYTSAAAFGGLLCLVLPFACAGLVHARSLCARISCVILLACGLFVTMDGAAHWAVLLTLVVLAARSVVPRPLFQRETEGVFPEAEKKRPAGNGVGFFLAICAGALLWQGVALPHLARVNDVAHFSSLALYDDVGQVNKRYAEWQAAYNMGITNPFAGVGLGNYQRFIGQYYDAVPRQPGPSVPDTQNLYLVLLGSTGVPGLLLFLACLSIPFLFQRGVRSGAPFDMRKETAVLLSSGCAGAVAAFSFCSIWHPLLARGVGLPLVFLLILAYRLRPQELTRVN